MPEIKASENQLNALELMKALLADAEWRRKYVLADGTEAKREVFVARRDDESTEDRLRRADYDAISGPARDLLERLSDSELALLADIDAAFVDSELSVENNPFPLMIY
jgi:hypothetical protein